MSKLPALEAVIRRQVGEIIGEASVCWKDGQIPTGKFDSEKAIQLVERLMELIDLETPNLGCATTGQLIEELRMRAEVGGYADYRTID